MNKTITEFVIRQIPSFPNLHRRDSLIFKLVDKFIKLYISGLRKKNSEFIDISPYNYHGNLLWPKINLGKVDSYCFFELPEMILHYYYYVNKNNYKIAVDLGSNIGIDTILMSKNGFQTYGFEPDTELYNKMLKNSKLNNLKNVKLFNKGISDKRETLNMVKVLDNQAANHIEGSRSFYGSSKKIKIEVIPFSEIDVEPDLMKINIEGSEKVVVPTISKHIWQKADAFIEIHDDINAKVLWDFFNEMKINIFSQKIGWKIANSLSDLPSNNKEGYIFVSKKPKMNWSFNK